MDDQRLAAQVQRGEQTAWAALVERHYDALFGYLFRLTYGNRALAEDLLHETFLRVMRGIHGYDSTRPFKPYLYAIATNLVRNHFSSADQRRTDSREPDDDLPAEEQQEIDALDEQQAVIAALRALPSAQREVIILAYYQALPLAEIAQTLDIPLGTVKSRLSNGVARLRERMKAHDSA